MSKLLFTFHSIYCSMQYTVINKRVKYFFCVGQLRGDVQPRQRFVPKLVGGDDNTKLLDGQRQAHKVVTNQRHR